MNERVIVSKELENIINKDNVFGNETSGEIPVTIWVRDCIIRSDIKSIVVSKNNLKLEFITTPMFAQNLLVSNKINRITIGDESFDIIECDNCDIKSLTVSAYEDMYLCRIIIQTSK
jgi:hypothetical protein